MTATENVRPPRRARRRRWPRRILWLAIVVVVADLGVCWWMASRLMHPRDPARVRGRTLPVASPGDAVVTTSDGLTLRGVVVERPGAHGVVVLFHGLGEWRLERDARTVADWGHIGVAFDFRGHGASDGDVTTFGWDEVRDVRAILAWVRTRWPGEKLALWGNSLGGAALCYAADETALAAAVVMECVYASVDTAFERRIQTSLPALLRPFAMPARVFVAWRLGLRPSDLQPMRYTGRLNAARTLLITGAQDPWSGPDELALLAAPIPDCATYIVEGAGHENLGKVGGDALRARVRAFVDERLR